MPKKLKTSLEAKKNRLRRRFVNGIGELIGAIGLLVSIALLCFLFIYAYSYALSTPYFEIRETAVRGLKELTEKDILTLASVPPRQNLLAVNTDSLVKKISANPWVKNIYVGRELPGRLVLEVRERIPVAMVKQASNFYLMDNEGFVFKKVGKSDEVDLPILTGAGSMKKEKSKLLLSALDLLKTISTSGRYGYLGAVSEVNVDDEFGISLLTDAGLYLKMGMDDYENKLQQLDVVMIDLEKRGMKKGYICADLRNVSKITIQRKNASGKTESGKKGKQYRT
ncbi:MAG: Cell division protein DivIB [Smithella sp. PtaU1.Bin162]|nr:MAG: Cell division protein DivIB [Smithella sp. PtaU1.Bin162]